MKLRLHFFEDQRLDQDVLESLANKVALDLGLGGRGIELQVEQITRIGNDEHDSSQAMAAMNICLTQAGLVNPDANILFVDLVLTDHGLSQDDQFNTYNAAVPQALALPANANFLDKARCGGYALAWKACCSNGVKNLLVIATGAHAGDAVSAQLERFRLQSIAEGNNANIIFYPEGDSLSTADTQDKERYLAKAVRKWLGNFWHPRTRIHPEDSDSWFDDTKKTAIPHNYSHIDDQISYQRVVCEYLAAVLQIPAQEAMKGYDALSNAHKDDLHEYLKALVGSDAACHCGKGKRLRWNHLLLLSVACAPAPGAWIFTDNFPWNACDSILPAGTSSFDKSLLDCLVGTKYGDAQGALSVALTDKIDRNQSRLDTISATKGLCEIKVTYGTEQLKANFDNGIKLNRKPTNDCSGILWELHKLLAAHDRGVCVKDKHIIIQQTKP